MIRRTQPQRVGGRPTRIGLIGFGAVATKLIEVLTAHGPRSNIALAAALVRRIPSESRPVSPKLLFATDLDAFLAQELDLVVECAGHEAVRSWCPAILQAGVDLTVVSIGALADPVTESSLRSAAERSGAQVSLPAGAVGGLDLLASARLSGLKCVQYISRKPPLAWVGTPAEALLRSTDHAGVQTLYEGNARDAALRFPQNANVAAAIALAGIGFERTEVALTSDPSATGNEHLVVVEGAFGRAEMRFAGRPLPENPKTSWLAPLSLARDVLNRNAHVVI